MANRIQLSLIFKDTEVFENLVVPYREARELTNLIQNLFASYYYNDRVRSLVDGFSEEELMEAESLANAQFAEAAARARETLAMANALSEQMDMVVGGGLDDIMAQMNDMASKSGGSVSEDTEFGTSMPEMGAGLHDMFNAAKQTAPEAAPEDWQDAILQASGGTEAPTGVTEAPTGVTGVSEEEKVAMQRVEEVLQNQEAMKKELREDLTKLVDDKLKGVTDTLSSQGRALSEQQSALGNITQMLQSLSEGMSNLQGSMKATAVVVDDAEPSTAEAEPATKVEDEVQSTVEEEPVSDDKDELEDLDLFDSDDEEEVATEEPLSGVNEEENPVEAMDSGTNEEEDDGLASLQLFLENGVAFSSPT